MRVLVTGGAGYIGSVITEQLLRRSHQAVVYDNFSTGHRAAVDPDAVLIEGSLHNQQKLTQTLQQQKIEAVIHLAAASQVSESVSDPQAYFHNNLTGGLSLLDAMKQADVGKIVFSSTCATYGAAEKIPMTEETPQLPVNPYGETLLAFERALRCYGAAYGLKYAILRCGNAAGATERYGECHSPESHLIPLVLRAASGRAESVKVFGEDYATPDGTCIRDYVHVLDLAEAHVLALRAVEKGNCIYNLGYGSGYSVREVIEMARQVTGIQIRMQPAKRRAGDVPVSISSPDKIMCDLGWQPRHSELENIIESAWQWHCAHPNGYDITT
jgi:UDP-glucose 4-epimerase